MKILHVIGSLARGGAERQLFLLCQASRQEADHCVVVFRPGGKWASMLTAIGVEVIALDCPLTHPLAVFRLRGVIVRQSPDLVHCWLPSANILGAFAAGSIPVVASIRNVDDWKPLYYRLLERLAVPFWDSVISNSHAGAELTRRAGVASRSITVIPNGVEHGALSRISNLIPTICTASRLVAQKRVDRIVDAARLLPGMKFLIAGDGPLRASLESEAPPNIRFLGEIDDIAWLYASSDLFVLASSREGTSNALIEAMSAGCVPVVTDVGDNARIVTDGVSGKVVSREASGGEIAAAIESSLGSLDGMRRAAEQAVKQFTVPAMARRTLEVYRNACSLPGLHQLDRARRRTA